MGEYNGIWLFFLAGLTAICLFCCYMFLSVLGSVVGSTTEALVDLGLAFIFFIGVLICIKAIIESLVTSYRHRGRRSLYNSQ